MLALITIKIVAAVTALVSLWLGAGYLYLRSRKPKTPLEGLYQQMKRDPHYRKAINSGAIRMLKSK